MHTKSRKLKIQREAFGQASIHYSHLTSFQKRDLKYKIVEVVYIRDHGKSDIKVLQGRPLFISQDIHAITQTAKQIEMPNAICIVSVEPTGKQIGVFLCLRKRTPSPYVDYPAFYPYPGTNIFYPVPRLEADYYIAYYRRPFAWSGNGHYSLSQLIKGVTHPVYPYIREDSVGPYCQKTRPPSENWHFRTPYGLNPLWLVDVHEHDGTGWDNYRPSPMFTLSISYYEEDTATIHIIPYHFTYPNDIYVAIKHHRTCWLVNINPITGTWSLDPPQRTCVYNFITDEVVGYF
jgi:hypothetical protein